MATTPNGHWTSWSTENFQYRIAADFVRQIEKAMESQGISQAMLAQRLHVTEGRVSQVLNNPGNLTLKKIIEYARAIDYKVSVVAYYDEDPQNFNGPVSSEIFAMCWYHAGSPHDFFELQASTCASVGTLSVSGTTTIINTNAAQVVTATGTSIPGLGIATSGTNNFGNVYFTADVSGSYGVGASWTVLHGCSTYVVGDTVHSAQGGWGTLDTGCTNRESYFSSHSMTIGQLEYAGTSTEYARGTR
jgi:predicted XRE-type DNA-binding protein